jgi:hypothetical protein
MSEPTITLSECRCCRRPIHWMPGVGWLHGELPQYAHEPITCERPHPVECGASHSYDAPCPLEAVRG